MYQQQGIARFVQQLASAESELRKQTADQLERTADGVADLMTRPVFDVASMQYYNEKLVNSLDVLKTASIEAKKIRDAAEGEMRGMVSQLSEAVAATSVRGAVMASYNAQSQDLMDGVLAVDLSRVDQS